MLELRRGSQRPGTYLHRCRAQRIRCLLGVARLEPLPALRAPGRLDVELGHERLHRWNLDLIRDLDRLVDQAAPTLQARGVPQFDFQRPIDPARPLPLRGGMSGSLARALRILFGGPFENGAACRFPARRAASSCSSAVFRVATSAAACSFNSATRCRRAAFSVAKSS